MKEVTMKRIYFTRNGNTMVFGEDGQQVAELQEPWIVIFFQFLETKGIDPLECTFHMADGIQAIPFRTSEGTWNWEFKGVR
jgi:hypothetical protein